MRKANLEVVIRDIETGEELVHDQASYIQAYIVIPENDGEKSLRAYTEGSASIMELSEIYRRTRDDVLNELWDGELELIQAASTFYGLFEADKNKGE